MKKIILFLFFAFFQFGIIIPLEQQAVAANAIGTTALEDTWKQFRQIHPYGFQTVALKHVDDACVFVISEPSEYVTETTLENLFSKYGGNIVIKHQPLGYEGWLGDAVGSIRFANESLFDSFTHDLFMLLYGTDYKAYYTDLDNPTEHVYFSDYRLNYSISAAELSKWFVTDKEEFKTSTGSLKTVSALLSSDISGTNELFYSKNQGFVVWIVDPGKINYNDNSFKINARKFALDTDLIIGALGNVGKKVAIIARERVVPVTTLPPLRIETIQLLATTDNDFLAQSFERFNVFAGKNSKNEDSCPIYLSDELWHTEYGNLLNMTDQMLKSWTENNSIYDFNYNYPAPIDWAFNDGVISDLGVYELTYNWNTAGAGYVIQDIDKLDIFAVNRTGSLPVSFIPDGMEGKVDEKVNEAEELAYDFFSELNSPELVREVQYATIYQIFRYFKKPVIDADIEWGDIFSSFPFQGIDLNTYQGIDIEKYQGIINKIKEEHGNSLIPDSYNKTFNSDNLGSKSDYSSVTKDRTNTVPRFTAYEAIVENLLRLVSDTTSVAFKQCYNEGLQRFSEKYREINAHTRLIELIQNDPYNGFKDYLAEEIGQNTMDYILNHEPHKEEIKELFDFYLHESIDSILPYINRYKRAYGSFPYSESAKYIVNKRDNNNYQKLNEKYIAQYDAIANKIKQKVDEYNLQVKNGTATWIDERTIENNIASAKRKLNDIEEKILKNKKEYLRYSTLMPTKRQEQALGTLNWLLTDPGPFEAPIGEFYASKFTSCRQWIKSSPIAYSKGRIGYGGHNLNAHITPIQISKASTKLPKGYCKVSEVNGQKVIAVSSADKTRVTPDVLRTIERKGINGSFKLPKAPAERPKSIVIGREQANTVRGFDAKQHNVPQVNKQAFVKGKEIESISDLRNSIAQEIAEKGTSSIKEVHFKDYSAREVHAYANDLKECIIERMPNERLNLKNFDINEDIQVISQGDGTVKLVLQQNLETLQQQGIYKSAMLNISVPEKAGASLKDAIINVYKKSEEMINNRFKWKRELRKELQKTHPEIDSYDIKEEFIQLIGQILITNEYENLFEQAA